MPQAQPELKKVRFTPLKPDMRPEIREIRRTRQRNRLEENGECVFMKDTWTNSCYSTSIKGSLCS
jgi:hypothetical protein